MFFKPVVDDKDVANDIEKVFDKLKDEIEVIFGCKIIREFCKANNIEVMAIAEESRVMEKLTKENKRNLLEKNNNVKRKYDTEWSIVLFVCKLSINNATIKKGMGIFSRILYIRDSFRIGGISIFLIIKVSYVMKIMLCKGEG